jgi:hypothetical protein
MIDESSQTAVDNLTAGYIKMMTELDAEVTEVGNIHIKGKFGPGGGNLNIDTISHEEALVLKITEDDDPSMMIEEFYGDLAEVADRINEIKNMEDDPVEF